MVAWIVSLMLVLQPVAPWAATYPTTATAIAHVAEDSPLFDGEQGAAKTAALLVALAWFESRFDVQALGDHGTANGLYQVHTDNLIVPASMVRNDAELATREAVRLIRLSFRVCRGRPLSERLAWYAKGGPTCAEAGYVKSRHRVELGMRLFREHPLEDDVD